MLVVAACGDSGSTSPPASTAEGAARGYQRALGPGYAGAMPPGSGPRIDGAWLTRDRRSVFVGFVGGPLYAAGDPCSEDYDGWAQVGLDRLEVGVWTVPHPERPPIVEQPGQPVIACPAVGFPYLFELRLPAPFAGSAVHDAHAGDLWIAPPERVADLPRIPDGWSLGTLTGDRTTHQLGRYYRPDPTANGPEDRYLYLGQVFGGAPSHQIDAVGSASIHGVDVPFGKNGDAGFIVSWRLGPDSLTLVSADPGLTLEEFVAMANAVAVPNP